MGLNISPFTKAMHKAKQQSKGLGKTLKTALGLLGVGFVLSRLANAVADFADKLIDTSKKLGVSTDFLQAWNFEALQIGISTETSNMALQRFGRRLGEAARGQGVLTAVLREGNISLRDSEGRMRSTTDVLADYADMVQNAESSNEQLRLSNLAFDSEGVGLVTMLRNGSDGLANMIVNARKLNAVVTNQSLVSINKLTTKLKMLGTSGLGIVAEGAGKTITALGRAAAFWGTLSHGMTSGVGLTEAIRAADDQLAQEEAMLEVQRIKKENIGKINEAEEKGVALEAQKLSLLQSQIDAQNALNTAKQDKTKTTVDEIAGTNVNKSLAEFFRKQKARGAVEKNLRERAAALQRVGRFDEALELSKQANSLRILIDMGKGINPRKLAEDREKAQRIKQLEEYADELGFFGNQEGAQQVRGQADKLRKEMGRLTSAEQNPNLALETAVAKSTEQLVTVNTQITEIKTSIAALNTP